MGKKKKNKQVKKEKSIKRSDDLPTIICRWIIQIGIFAALLVPLIVNLNLYYPFAGIKGMWFMGVVQVITVAWIFLAYHNKAYRPKSDLIVILVALYIAAMALSTVFGADAFMSFWSKHSRMSGLLMHFHLLAFFLIAVTFFKTEKEWRTLLSTAVGLAVIVAVWGLADNYGVDPILKLFDFIRIISINVADVSQKGATLGHYSFMGTYLLINCFLALYLGIKAETSRLKWFYGFSFIILALGILLNPGGRAMRGAFLIGLVIIALLYFSFHFRNRIVNRGSSVLLGAGLIASIYVGLSAFREGSFVRNTIMGLFNMPGRLAKWNCAWQGFLERPFLGWGPENFDLVLYHFYDPRLMLDIDGFVGEPWHDRAHNIVFDSLVATGLLGTILFFGILAAALFLLWKGYLKNEGIDFWTTAVFTTLFAAHFIQNLTVFDMLSSYMLLFLIFAYISFITIRKTENSDKQDPENIPLKLPSALLLVALTALLIPSLNYFVYQPYTAGKLINQAILNNNKIALVDEYAAAIEASPLGVQQVRRRLSEKAITRLNRAGNLEEEMIYFPEIEYLIEEAERSTVKSPINFRRFYMLGQLHNTYAIALRKYSEDAALIEKAIESSLAAEEAFTRAIELSPTGIPAYWGLIQAKINVGFLLADREKFTEAFDVTMQALEIEDRFISTYEFGVNIAYNLLQDRDLAFAIKEQALAIDPSWEDAFDRYIGD